MEHLSKSLVLLSDKIKILLTSYSALLKENEMLKNKILTLEEDVHNLEFSLKEKRELLTGKDEDDIFIAMLIDDLLEHISVFSRDTNNFFIESKLSFTVSEDCNKMSALS